MRKWTAKSLSYCILHMKTLVTTINSRENTTHAFHKFDIETDLSKTCILSIKHQTILLKWCVRIVFQQVILRSRGDSATCFVATHHPGGKYWANRWFLKSTPIQKATRIGWHMWEIDLRFAWVDKPATIISVDDEIIKSCESEESGSIFWHTVVK